MNRTEKLISALLGCVLAWYLFWEMPKQEAADKERQNAAESAAAGARPSTEPTAPTQAAPKPAAPAAEVKPAEKPAEPEKTYSLENEQLKLSISSWGGTVVKATLKEYARFKEAVGRENSPVEFDFAAAPLGALRNAGQTCPEALKMVSCTPTNIVFAGTSGRREITLLPGYVVRFDDTPAAKSASPVKKTLSLGSIAMGGEADDLLSVDSWAMDAKGGKVVHHCEGESPLKGFLAGGAAGGCSGAPAAAGMAPSVRVDYPGPQKWVALKNRFFVTALSGISSPSGGTVANSGFAAVVERDTASQTYRPSRISAEMSIEADGAVSSLFYIGPKKQSLLWDLGMRDVMEFGMWRVICYPLVWILNFFNSIVPNYGVAIILLTILVRILFWPLNHKSTLGMKKMQELQPKMKEIQEKFKGNPQRLQQEMMALYRENKVNPLSSCLPMLAQIPVFIALFNVLRSAVELRYASFLWISDLSAPEGLGADSWFPWFGGLNILPVLMAATMGLQSALTPGTGDKKQKQMMTVMMPAMMLFMFYRFASALSLYWTLSQAVSIFQMWLIRRSAAGNAAASGVTVEEPVVTRQMRRHGN